MLFLAIAAVTKPERLAIMYGYIKHGLMVRISLNVNEPF